MVTVGQGRRARFVTLDGPSAVGKTTASRLLGEVLRTRGCDCMVTTTPSASAVGILARASTHRLSGYALSCLVAADRYEHHQRVVRPAVDACRTVVCDRYVPSALVLDRLDGVPSDYVAALYGPLPRPDLAFVLVGDPAVCAARAVSRGARYSRFHYYDLGIHERERGLFEEAINVLGQWSYPVVRIDVDGHDPVTIAGKLADIVCATREGIA